jgi:hypothetical protein
VWVKRASGDCVWYLLVINIEYEDVGENYVQRAMSYTAAGHANGEPTTVYSCAT